MLRVSGLFRRPLVTTPPPGDNSPPSIVFHVVVGAGRVGTAAALSTLVGVYQRKLIHNSHQAHHHDSKASSSPSFPLECVLLVDKDVETVESIRQYASRSFGTWDVNNNNNASLAHHKQADLPIAALPLTHTFNKGRVGGGITTHRSPTAFATTSSTLAVGGGGRGANTALFSSSSSSSSYTDVLSPQKNRLLSEGVLTALIPHHRASDVFGSHKTTATLEEGRLSPSSPSPSQNTKKKGVFQVVGSTTAAPPSPDNSKSKTSDTGGVKEEEQQQQQMMREGRRRAAVLSSFPMLTACTLSEFNALTKAIITADEKGGEKDRQQTQLDGDDTSKDKASSNNNSNADAAIDAASLEWLTRFAQQQHPILSSSSPSSTYRSLPILSIATVSVCTHFSDLIPFKGARWHSDGSASAGSAGGHFYGDFFDGEGLSSISSSSSTSSSSTQRARRERDASRDSLMRSLKRLAINNKVSVQNNAASSSSFFLFSRGLSEAGTTPQAYFTEALLGLPRKMTAMGGGKNNSDTGIATVSGPIYPEVWAHESCALLEYLRHCEENGGGGEGNGADAKTVSSSMAGGIDEEEDIEALFREEKHIPRFTLPPKSGTVLAIEGNAIGCCGDEDHNGTPTRLSSSPLFTREVFGIGSSLSSSSSPTTLPFVNGLLIIAPLIGGMLTANPSQYILTPPTSTTTTCVPSDDRDGDANNTTANIAPSTSSAAVGEGSSSHTSMNGGVAEKKVKRGGRMQPITLPSSASAAAEDSSPAATARHNHDQTMTNSHTTPFRTKPWTGGQALTTITPLALTSYTVNTLNASLSFAWRVVAQLALWERRAAVMTTMEKKKSSESDADIVGDVSFSSFSSSLSPALSAVIESALSAALTDSSSKSFTYGRRYGTFKTIGASVGGAYGSAANASDLHVLEATGDGIMALCEAWDAALGSVEEAMKREAARRAVMKKGKNIGSADINTNTNANIPKEDAALESASDADVDTAVNTNTNMQKDVEAKRSDVDTAAAGKANMQKDVDTAAAGKAKRLVIRALAEATGQQAKRPQWQQKHPSTFANQTLDNNSESDSLRRAIVREALSQQLTLSDVRTAVAFLTMMVTSQRGISMSVQNHCRALLRCDGEEDPSDGGDNLASSPSSHDCGEDSTSNNENRENDKNEDASSSIALSFSPSSSSSSVERSVAHQYWLHAEEDAFKDGGEYQHLRGLDRVVVSGGTIEDFKRAQQQTSF